MTSDLAAMVLKQAAFWLAFLAMYLMEGRLRARESASASQDEKSRDAIGLSLVGGFILGWILSALPFGRWHSPGVFWAGIGLMVAGLAVRSYAVHSLGRAFSVYATVREGQGLVESGPYRLLRHPAYTGVLLWLIGIGFAFGNPFSLAVVVGVPFLWGYRYRMQVEETLLLGAWGDTYRDYMRRTYRLIPFVW
jgi:protein-S-isoprenylcysteine O-methyltransferase Ste14